MYTLKKSNILIVDDSKFERELMKNAFTRFGDYEILEAENGTRGLGILSEKEVSLVLLDILMSDLDGIETLIKMRQKFNALELPVIMITSKSEVFDLVKCLRSGANDYITKPVNFEAAHSRIETHLKISEMAIEMNKLKELAALDALIGTYNHQINNPLSIAIGCLESPELKGSKVFGVLENALWRIAKIVKEIGAISEKKEIEFKEYCGSTKIIKTD